MGGRGKTLEKNYRQQDINKLTQYIEVKNIIDDSEIIRKSLEGIGNGSRGGMPLYKKCACCEQYTILVSEENAVCFICGWIDDGFQNTHPNSNNGKNPISLNVAKEQYRIATLGF